MKILTVCAGGVCRSVTLAAMLKYGFKGNHDVLAASAEKNMPPTLQMLFQWSQLILTVDEEVHAAVLEMHPTRHHDKIKLIPIGQDKWGMSMHPGLVTLAWPLLIEAGFEPRRTLEEQLGRSTKYSLRRGQADPLGDIE